jgi:hypothetical protein
LLRSKPRSLALQLTQPGELCLERLSFVLLGLDAPSGLAELALLWPDDHDEHEQREGDYCAGGDEETSPPGHGCPG